MNPEPETKVTQESPEVSPQELQKKETKRRTKPVIVYLTILIVVVLALLALSYAMQHRNTKELQNINQSITQMESNYDALTTINDMQATISDQNAKIDDLEKQVSELQTQLETAEAAQKEAETQAEDLEAQANALKLLAQLAEAYLQNDKATCDTLNKELAEVADNLPAEQAKLYETLKAAVEQMEGTTAESQTTESATAQ